MFGIDIYFFFTNIEHFIIASYLEVLVPSIGRRIILIVVFIIVLIIFVLLLTDLSIIKFVPLGFSFLALMMYILVTARGRLTKLLWGFLLLLRVLTSLMKFVSRWALRNIVHFIFLLYWWVRASIIRNRLHLFLIACCLSEWLTPITSLCCTNLLKATSSRFGFSRWQTISKAVEKVCACTWDNGLITTSEIFLSRGLISLFFPVIEIVEEKIHILFVIF